VSVCQFDILFEKKRLPAGRPQNAPINKPIDKTTIIEAFCGERGNKKGPHPRPLSQKGRGESRRGRGGAPSIPLRGTSPQGGRASAPHVAETADGGMTPPRLGRAGDIKRSPSRRIIVENPESYNNPAGRCEKPVIVQPDHYAASRVPSGKPIRVQLSLGPARVCSFQLEAILCQGRAQS